MWGEKVAAGGAVSPFAAAVWVWLAHATDVMQFISFLMGALAAAASAYYYITKARQAKKSGEGK